MTSRLISSYADWPIDIQRDMNAMENPIGSDSEAIYTKSPMERADEAQLPITSMADKNTRDS